MRTKNSSYAPASSPSISGAGPNGTGGRLRRRRADGQCIASESLFEHQPDAHRFRVCPLQCGRQPGTLFASNNLALPAALFRATGGFDATLTTSEDRELCDRWLHSGYRMVYAPEAVVHHAHSLTLRTFCRQHFNYGRGACRFYQIRARVRQEPARLQARAFYIDMLRYPFLRAHGRQALVLATLLVVSQGASASGLLWEKASQISRAH